MPPDQRARATTGAAFDVVVLAASAGGLAALGAVIRHLPGDFPAPIIAIQHLAPNHESVLARILGRGSRLSVRQAAEGDRVIPGVVFVAPPDLHVLLGPRGRLQLRRSAPVNFSRPSADVTMASAAAACGKRAIGVVLSGAGRDGCDGVRSIKAAGGTVIVQSERSAEFGGMPGAALRTGCADLVLPLDDIAPALIGLAYEKVPG